MLLADDHEILLEGLRELLNRHFFVLACASGGRQLVSLAAQLKPEIIVTDINMPDLNGVDAVKQIRDAGLAARAVFLTMLHETAIAMKAFRAGGFVAGYVLKNSAGTELVAAIREVQAGRSYMTPRITRDVLRECFATAEPVPGGITPRQTEVLRLITQGKTMKEVASAPLDLHAHGGGSQISDDGTSRIQNHRPTDSLCCPTGTHVGGLARGVDRRGLGAHASVLNPAARKGCLKLLAHAAYGFPLRISSRVRSRNPAD